MSVLAKHFSFDVIVILLHTLVEIVRSHHCLFVCCLYFFLLLFLLPLGANKDDQCNFQPTKNIGTKMSIYNSVHICSKETPE